VKRGLAGVLCALAIAGALSACSTGAAPTPAQNSAVTTPQPSLAGEWVLTRTVTASDDTSDAERAVDATSTRFLLIEQTDCGALGCPGTVSSGAAIDARDSTEFEQVDGGLGYTFTGALNCLRQDGGAVLAVDAFTFSQTADLAVVETADLDGVLTATLLEGTISYTDTLTTSAMEQGCSRDPATVTVKYAVSARRADR